ncbi:MAG: J domain-containing protein, partial [Actinobacteria bacterium]|nr:J domain-containing protein [Actinomycetota bacterium]
MKLTATHYETLHVSREASEAEIDDAYRRLGRECLDGSMPPIEAEKQLKRIREAYSVIGDPAKRLAYDRQAPANPLAPSSAGLPSAHQGSPARTSHTLAVTGRALGTEAAPILRTTTDTVPHHGFRVTPSSAGNARTPLRRTSVAVGVAVGIIGVLVAIGRANSGSSASQQLAPTEAAKPAVGTTTPPAMTEPAPEVFVSTETVRKVLDSILRCDLIEETLTPTSDADVVRPCGT